MLNVSETVGLPDTVTILNTTDLHTLYSKVSDFEWPPVTLSELAKYSLTQSIARLLCDSWASCCYMFILYSNLDFSPILPKRDTLPIYFKSFVTILLSTTQITQSSLLLTLWSAEAILVTSNDVKMVHWPLIGGLLHLVQRGADSTGNVGCVLHNIRSPSRLYTCSCALLLCDLLAHATLFWLFWSRCWQLSSHRYQLRSPSYWWSNEMGLRFSKFWGISSRYGSPHKLA